MIETKGILSKIKMASSAEKAIPDLYHVTIFLPFTVAFLLLPIFFILETIEKVIHIHLIHLLYQFTVFYVVVVAAVFC